MTRSPRTNVPRQSKARTSASKSLRITIHNVDPVTLIVTLWDRHLSASARPLVQRVKIAGNQSYNGVILKPGPDGRGLVEWLVQDDDGILVGRGKNVDLFSEGEVQVRRTLQQAAEKRASALRASC
jgi:hypothetical protein